MNKFVLSLEQLKKICEKHDILNKSYPGYNNEGYTIYRYICEELELELEEPENWNRKS